MIKTYIKTDRLLLRDWKASDLEEFIRINSDSMVMEYMPRILKPEDSKRLMKKFQDHIEKNGYGMFAVEVKETKEFIGTVGICKVRFDAPFTPAVEIAWRLSYESWGKGYATEAARAVMDYGFNELNLDEIVAFTIHDNARGIHVMEKLGMKRDKKGDFIYPRLKKEHPLALHCLFRIDRTQYTKDLEAA